MADASALVRSVAGVTWVTDGALVAEVPDIIVTVVLAAAKRAFINPDGVRSEAIDGYSTNYASSSPDVYLTAKEERQVRGAVSTGGGLWTQATTRTEAADLPTVFLDVEPPGEPIPWAPSPDPF